MTLYQQYSKYEPVSVSEIQWKFNEFQQMSFTHLISVNIGPLFFFPVVLYWIFTESQGLSYWFKFRVFTRVG